MLTTEELWRKKTTPLLSPRTGYGGGWYPLRMPTNPSPSLPRRGIVLRGRGSRPGLVCSFPY